MCGRIRAMLGARAAAAHEGCGTSIMWSNSYSYDWGCMCCAPTPSTSAHKYWGVYDFEIMVPPPYAFTSTAALKTAVQAYNTNPAAAIATYGLIGHCRLGRLGRHRYELPVL